MPRVTVSVNSPSGLPMASTVSPTLILDESPSVAAVSVPPVARMTAMSCVGSVLTTVALSSWPSAVVTVS